MEDQKEMKTAEKAKRRFHALLVYVIFQTLVVIVLFIAIVYKAAETVSNL